MRESPEHAAAERKALVRASERRREAIGALRIGECACRYGASRLANGISPEEARATVIEMAAELSQVAVVLRRMSRVTSTERRVLAVRLAALGMSRVQIAGRLGVSERSVFEYLRSRSAAGG